MLDVLKVSINPTALSNIETIVGIIVAIIGIPGAICAAILKIKNIKNLKMEMKIWILQIQQEAPLFNQTEKVS